jgi:hypothetical protein
MPAKGPPSARQPEEYGEDLDEWIKTGLHKRKHLNLLRDRMATTGPSEPALPAVIIP